MSLLGRIGFAIRSKLNALLNRSSDPSAELDYSYEQSRDELQKVTRGIADVTTQKAGGTRSERTTGECARRQ